jgi:tRNA threonylcarbamoyladenosine biosynthesis protein TsaB
MKILALDTATEACSAALWIDGEISVEYQLAPREHSRLILQMIEDLLQQAGVAVSELSAIAFGRGPGSFMGLRIAAGVVQGIAFAHDIPVVPVSTLKAIALRASEETQHSHILAAIDARMDEVYWGAYSLNGQQWLQHGEECVISPDRVELPGIQHASWVAAGTGWGTYRDRLSQRINCNLQQVMADCYPSAEQIVKLAVEEFRGGNTVTAAQAVPVYLRNDVAKKPKPAVF